MRFRVGPVPDTGPIFRRLVGSGGAGGPIRQIARAESGDNRIVVGRSSALAGNCGREQRELVAIDYPQRAALGKLEADDLAG
jgi:hypothetical protein